MALGQGVRVVNLATEQQLGIVLELLSWFRRNRPVYAVVVTDRMN